MAGPVQSHYEKLTSTGLFLLVAALGWGPFVIAAWHAPYIERAFLFVSLALGFLSLALLYDAAEHFVSRGRGVYFAAIFCSLPATGVLISDPGMIPITMLLLLVSAAMWFAVRATGEQRAFLLAMLAGLLVISGYGFSLFPGALAFLFAIWLAASRSSRRIALTGILLAGYGVGIFMRQIGGLALPTLQLPLDSEKFVAAAVLMPWRLYALLVLILLLLAPRKVTRWHIAAVATLIAALLISAISRTNMPAASAVLTPVLTLLAGSLALESFLPDLERFRRWPLALPPLLAAISIVVTAILGMTGSAGVPAPGNIRIVFAVMISALLIIATFRHLPRWNFALLFASGLWFGSFFWPQAEFLPEQSAPIPSQIWWIVVAVALILGWILFRAYYGRRIPSKALLVGRRRFGGEDFRTFHNTKVWEGKQVSSANTAGESFSFMIFGDVTGAESPMTARHGGYFAFRSLIERMKQDAPRFAISLGDLAISATTLSFRRVRQLLRLVPVPLMAIPGNHDVFHGTHDDTRYFLSLFGADNRSFRIGPVQFMLINNAVGAYDGPPLAWLEETLQQSDAPFLLLFCHKPVFDLRPGGSYAMERRDQAMHLHDLFRSHEVTAVFSGHVHTLISEVRDGVTYIISGGGGSKLTSAEDVHHYLRVDVTVETAHSRAALHVRAFPVEFISPAAPLLELHFSPRTCSFAVPAFRT